MSTDRVDAETGEIIEEAQPLAIVQPHALSAWNRDQIDLIKRTVAMGCTDDELKLFLYTARRVGLDPLLRQIHAVRRWNSQAGREVMAIQVAIDGYRLVADRTEKYAPGPQPTFEYAENPDGAKRQLVSATSYVRKLVGGQWHDIAATAHFDEYKQTRKDGQLMGMWASKPHIMLAKCAEALAIRRAFPAETAGTYGDDEMPQLDKPEAPRFNSPALGAAVKELDQALSSGASVTTTAANRSSTAAGATPSPAPSTGAPPPESAPANRKADAAAKKRYTDALTAVCKLANTARTQAEAIPVDDIARALARAGYIALAQRLSDMSVKAIDATSATPPKDGDWYGRNAPKLEKAVEEATLAYGIAESSDLPF